MGKWPNILGRADNEASEDNVAPFPSLERDAQPTRPSPYAYAPGHPLHVPPPPPPAPKKRKSLLPEGVENELIISQEMIEVLYPLEQEGRDRIMKMIVDTLSLYPKQKPEAAAEHPEGSPV